MHIYEYFLEGNFFHWFSDLCFSLLENEKIILLFYILSISLKRQNMTWKKNQFDVKIWNISIHLLNNNTFTSAIDIIEDEPYFHMTSLILSLIT